MVQKFQSCALFGCVLSVLPMVHMVVSEVVDPIQSMERRDNMRFCRHQPHIHSGQCLSGRLTYFWKQTDFVLKQTQHILCPICIKPVPFPLYHVLFLMQQGGRYENTSNILKPSLLQ